MCSYALAYNYHSCHKCEHNSPAPVAKKVFLKDPIPLNEVKVNLSFISRLPKLLEINWKCIYEEEPTISLTKFCQDEDGREYFAYNQHILLE